MLGNNGPDDDDDEKVVMMLLFSYKLGKYPVVLDKMYISSTPAMTHLCLTIAEASKTHSKLSSIMF